MSKARRTQTRSGQRPETRSPAHAAFRSGITGIGTLGENLNVDQGAAAQGPAGQRRWQERRRTWSRPLAPRRPVTLTACSPSCRKSRRRPPTSARCKPGPVAGLCAARARLRARWSSRSCRALPLIAHHRVLIACKVAELGPKAPIAVPCAPAVSAGPSYRLAYHTQSV